VGRAAAEAHQELETQFAEMQKRFDENVARVLEAVKERELRAHLEKTARRKMQEARSEAREELNAASCRPSPIRNPISAFMRLRWRRSVLAGCNPARRFACAGSAIPWCCGGLTDRPLKSRPGRCA